MSGSAASDMVGLWQLAESLSIDKDLEKLIKAWLGFQAESLQKQANESVCDHKRLTNILIFLNLLSVFAWSGEARKREHGGGPSFWRWLTESAFRRLKLL